MIEDASYTIEWDNLYGRFLGGMSMSASLFVAAAATAALGF